MAQSPIMKARSPAWGEERSRFGRTQRIVTAALLVLSGLGAGSILFGSPSSGLGTVLEFGMGAPASGPVIGEPVSVLTADASRQSAVLVDDPALGVIHVHLLNLPDVHRARYSLWSVSRSGEQVFLGQIAEDAALTIPKDALGETGNQLIVTLEPLSTETGTRTGPLILSGQIGSMH